MAFKEVRIGDYFRFSKGLGYLGKYLEPSNVGLIGLNSFEAGGGYKFGGEKPYSGPYKEQHRAHPGDLFIATTDITQDGRVLGSPFLLPFDIIDFDSFIFSGDIVKGEPITQEFSAEYLFNILRVKNVREKIAYASTGTTVRRVPVEVVENVYVSIPPPAIQRTICLILSSIDEKIRVNKQIASTLEQIAQTIFKSWFVDFDPVHAKARGEQPVGMDAETAALFPDSFEDSELGPIPAGWGLNPLATNFHLISGGTPKTNNSDFWDGDIPWYSVVDIPSDSPFFVATSKYITKLGVEKSAVNLVDEGTTIISARGTVGKLAMAGVKAAFNQSCYGIKGKFTDYFTYLLVQNSVKRLQAMTHGGTFDTITRTTFDAINVATVPESVQIAFEELVQPLFEQMKLISHQNVTLAQCRDSLLPRLISGELEIPAELLDA